MSDIPRIAPEVYARRDHTEAILGTRGIFVRLTLASGSTIERKYALIEADLANGGSGFLTRAYALGDMVALHASGFVDSLHVADTRYHEIDLEGFDPIVGVHVENCRIP